MITDAQVARILNCWREDGSGRIGGVWQNACDPMPLCADFTEWVQRVVDERDELLEALRAVAYWFQREDGKTPDYPEGGWGPKRETPGGEAEWRQWHEENIRACGEASMLVEAAIAKAEGRDENDGE